MTKPDAAPEASQPTRSDAMRHQAAFLAAFGEAGSITKAAEAAGIDRREHYRWLEGNESYQDRWAAAEEELTTRLEAEAIRRAVDGWDEPVYQGGTLVGTIRKFSDRMLELLLKARRPNAYRDRATVEHTGAGGGPVLLRTIGLSDAELADLDRPED